MRHATLLLGLALAACAGGGTPPTQQAGTGPELAALASLPERIGGFDRHAAPQPDTTPGVTSGATQRLLTKDGYATIYLFRRDAEAPPDGARSPQARAELAGATQAMLAALQVASRPPGPLQPVGLAGGAPGTDIRCAGVALPDGTGIRTEAVCVGATGGRLLKTRVTLRLPGPPVDPRVAATAAAMGALGLTGEIQSRRRGSGTQRA
jgi:hypothetical protein